MAAFSGRPVRPRGLGFGLGVLTTLAVGAVLVGALGRGPLAGATGITGSADGSPITAATGAAATLRAPTNHPVVTRPPYPFEGPRCPSPNSES